LSAKPSTLARVATSVWPVACPIAVAVAAVFVFSLGSDAFQRDGVYMLVNMLAVIGLWTFMGNSGVISFGHIAFFGIGAYTSALMTAEPTLKKLLIHGMPTFLADAHTSTLAGMLIAGAVAALVAGVIAAPIVRLSGISAGIATFAVLQIVHTVLSQWRSVTNGLQTFSGIPVDATLWSTLPYVVIAIVGAFLFGRSRTGLRLRASREDPVAARSVGIGIGRDRGVAWIISAFIVGVAGAVYAHYQGAITANSFYFDATFLIIAMLVVGGMKSLSGAVVGTVAVTAVTRLLDAVESSSASLQGLTGVGLAVFLGGILILRPRGITNGREFRAPAALRRARGRERELSVA
jgi:branched-chain amino acid transport system permease protein